MSHDADEIVFDELSFREPQKLRRPDHDRHYVCAAYEVPLPIDLPIYLDLEAADAIERHALRDTKVELGGILLGKEGIDDISGERFVWVTQSLEAKHYENTQASFTYTHESWEEITRERDKAFPDLHIVGWYHTHPDFGVFLSGHDLFIHHNFFPQPLQLAYVVDPIRQTRNFFQWRDGRMEQVGGFFITGERTERVRLARLVNDLENIKTPADSDSASARSGSGLTPRLEAELIAMLSRSNTSHQNHAGSLNDRTQLAALFAMVGGIVGVLGFASILWLNHLGSMVYQQSQTLQELAKRSEEANARERLAIDAALGTLSPEQSSSKFLEQYKKAVGERDQARALLNDRTAINDTLGARTKALTDQVQSLQTKTAELQDLADSAKDVPDLREQLAALEAANRKQSATIDDLNATLATVDGEKAVELRKTYQTTWYAALIGWALTLILGVGLVGVYALLRRTEDPPPTASEHVPTVKIN